MAQTYQRLNYSSCKLVHSHCKYLFIPLKRYLFYSYLCVCMHTRGHAWVCRCPWKQEVNFSQQATLSIHNTVQTHTSSCNGDEIICFLISRTAIHYIYTGFLSLHFQVAFKYVFYLEFTIIKEKGDSRSILKRTICLHKFRACYSFLLYHMYLKIKVLCISNAVIPKYLHSVVNFGGH